MAAILPAVSQNISKGEIKTTVNDKGDTVVIMSLHHARVILSDLMDYNIVDSLLRIYKVRDSLSGSTIALQKDVIDKLTQKSDNQSVQLTNFQSIAGNKDKEIALKEDVIKSQKKEIRKQKVLKLLGFAGSIILPILTLIAVM